jgi:hypothetical protein
MLSIIKIIYEITSITLTENGEDGREGACTWQAAGLCQWQQSGRVALTGAAAGRASVINFV